MKPREDTEALMSTAHRKIAQGATFDDILNFLGEHRVSIIDCIKMVRVLFGINLGDAKRIVSAHPSWKEEAESASGLHDAAEAAFKSPHQP